MRNEKICINRKTLIISFIIVLLLGIVSISYLAQQKISVKSRADEPQSSPQESLDAMTKEITESTTDIQNNTDVSYCPGGRCVIPGDNNKPEGYCGNDEEVVDMTGTTCNQKKGYCCFKKENIVQQPCLDYGPPMGKKCLVLQDDIWSPAMWTLLTFRYGKIDMMSKVPLKFKYKNVAY